jgi:hypothetical protein|tara:strand:+ start:4018 stop:4197 length:180 start_codon:yes stop_codon:yes gene_type:complete
MKFEDAIEKSIKSFLKGNMPEELMKVQGNPVIYTPDYMDELETDLADMEIEDEEEVDDV